MIIGFVNVENWTVVTHRDSFMLSNVSVVSVRRPYLAGAILLCGASLGFGLAFIDLLYESELITLACVAFGLLVVGTQTAQLSLLSRDLKGTELSSAVWGTLGSLQKVRTKIVRERQKESTGDSHAA